MNYTITQAAEAVGKGRSTIHRAIKEGRLSAHRGEGGTYYVDASELARVFSMAFHKPAHRDTTADRETPSETGVSVLSLRVSMLEAALEREKDVLAHEREAHERDRETSSLTIEDLRRRLDRAEERVLALSPPPAPELPQERAPIGRGASVNLERPRGLLARLWATRVSSGSR